MPRNKIIRVSEKTITMLKNQKTTDYETYDEIIQRLLKNA